MRTVRVQGVEVPWILYGTAWKEERTTELVEQALAAGFRGLDTANQRKHYVEADVGRGIAAAGIARDQLFVQTKYTYARGQDHRLPFDPKAAIAEQVEQSFTSSLLHLGVETLDALLLHGPQHSHGISADDHAVWARLEDLHRRGHVRLIGVSNASVEQLDALSAKASVPIAIVQNRCYARDGWDREVRAWCADHGARYQGFSLLTANRSELARPEVAAIAKRHGVSVAELVFAFARQLGIIVLTGTADARHMKADLAADRIALDPAELKTLGG
ncbi:MAG TPA: aldo/keto reductase [Kofleriaceae bacterium]|nr:aldo/keto reductase [Kofleriaceae bacterium]